MRLRLPSIGLFGRTFAMVVIALGIMLASFAILGVQAVAESTARTLQERSSLSKAIAGRVDDRLEESIRIVQVMIETQHLSPAGDSTVVHHWIQDTRMQLGNFATWIAVVDASGHLVDADPSTDEVRQFDFRDAKCIQYVFENKKPVISCAFTIGVSIPISAMVVPILKEDQIVGAVFTALNLNSPTFTQVLEPLGLGTTAYAEVVDAHGLIIASTRPDLLWQQDDHNGEFTALIENHTTTVGTCHSCHAGQNTVANRQEEIMAFAPLISAKWGVAIRQSRDEAFAYGDTLQQQSLLLGMAAFLGAAVLTWFLIRQLVRPLKGLTQACEQIAGGNLSMPLPPGGTSEIGTLANAFDTMRRQLRMSLDKIQAWNSELEGRVQKRTQELEESRKQLLDANRELSVLNTLGSALRQSVDLETTLNLALERVMALGNVWGASICLLDQEGTKLMPKPHHSIHLNGSCACEWTGVNSMIGRVLQDRQVVVVQVPLVLSSENKIESHEGAETHPVICVPLTGKNRNLGVMIMINPNGHTFASSEIELLSSIGVQIGIAIENALLINALKEKEQARTELLRKIIATQEEERRRIARELHDETSQALTALNVGLKAAIMAPAENPEDVKQRLVPLKTQAAGMLDEIQRMIRDLRPSLLDDLGLVSAIDWYAEVRLKTQGIQVEWEVIGTERRLSPELETTLFRVAQEAISNIARHAQAENVSILLGFESNFVTLEVEDDGKGFAMGEALPTARVTEAYGLLGMRERASLLGGELLIESQVGQGTRVQARIPISRDGVDSSSAVQPITLQTATSSPPNYS
jgi:signal transduction histidine kinase